MTRKDGERSRSNEKARPILERYYAIRIGQYPKHQPYFAGRGLNEIVPALFVTRSEASQHKRDWCVVGKVVRVMLTDANRKALR
jgi:hypothetical protein